MKSPASHSELHTAADKMRRSSSPSNQKHLQNARGLRYVLISASGDGTKWIKEGKHFCNVAPVQFPI